MPATGKTARIALEVLYTVIDELNPELPDEQQLLKSPEARVFGGEEGLESIDLVRLIVLYEQEIAAVTGRSISMTDDRAASETHSQFNTVGSLAAFAALLIEEEGGVD